MDQSRPIKRLGSSYPHFWVPPYLGPIRFDYNNKIRHDNAYGRGVDLGVCHVPIPGAEPQRTLTFWVPILMLTTFRYIDQSCNGNM